MRRADRGEFTVAQRSLRSWLAAYRSWERTADAAARTASARRAATVGSSARLPREGVWSPEERACRGTAAMRAYFTALALRSSRAHAKAAVVKRAASVRLSTARGRPGSSREEVRCGEGACAECGSEVMRRRGCGGAGVVSAGGHRSQASMSARSLDEVSLRLLLDRAVRRRDAGDANPARPRALPASARCVAVRRCDVEVRARSLGIRASVARARVAAIPVRSRAL
jgi:hypothetical protein